MAGWHPWLNGCESEQTPGDNEGQGSPLCYSPWGHKETQFSDWTGTAVETQGKPVVPWVCKCSGDGCKCLQGKCGGHDYWAIKPGLWWSNSGNLLRCFKLPFTPSLCENCVWDVNHSCKASKIVLPSTCCAVQWAVISTDKVYILPNLRPAVLSHLSLCVHSTSSARVDSLWDLGPEVGYQRQHRLLGITDAALGALYFSGFDLFSSVTSFIRNDFAKSRTQLSDWTELNWMLNKPTLHLHGWLLRSNQLLVESASIEAKVLWIYFFLLDVIIFPNSSF